MLNGPMMAGQRRLRSQTICMVSRMNLATVSGSSKYPAPGTWICPQAIRKLQDISTLHGFESFPSTTTALAKHPAVGSSCSERALRRPYAVLFLPAILTLVPVIPIVKLLCKRTAVYLAGDYETPARELAIGKWFGWSMLYRKGLKPRSSSRMWSLLAVVSWPTWPENTIEK